MEKELEDTFHEVDDAVVCEEVPATIKKRSVAPPKTDQILARDAITDNYFHLEEVKTKLVLDNLTSQRNGVDNRPSAALESFVEGLVREVVRSPQTIGRVAKAVIKNLIIYRPNFSPCHSGTMKIY